MITLNLLKGIDKRVIRFKEVTEIQVRIPQCCRDGGVIMDSHGRTIGPCPHVAQMRKIKKGNVGL